MKFSAKSQIALADLISSNDISDLFCFTPNMSSLHLTERQRTAEVPLLSSQKQQLCKRLGWRADGEWENLVSALVYMSFIFIFLFSSQKVFLSINAATGLQKSVTNLKCWSSDKAPLSKRKLCLLLAMVCCSYYSSVSYRSITWKCSWIWPKSCTPMAGFIFGGSRWQVQTRAST